MKKIFKYDLPIDGETEIIKMKVIKWLDIKTQNGVPRIWAIVDPDAMPETYEVVAWGTGWDVPEELGNYGYMGTALDGLGFVWHYFMRQVRPSHDITLEEAELYFADALASKIEASGLFTEEQDWTTSLTYTI